MGSTDGARYGGPESVGTAVARPVGRRTAGSRPSARPWLTVAAAMLCCAWGGNHFTPLLLMYRQLSGYSTLTVDLFLAVYILGLVPGLLVAGRASDRYGRRPVLLLGVAVSIVGSIVLSTAAYGAAVIYCGRMLTGAAVGISMSVGTTWLKELSQRPYDPAADAGAGARRASLALATGFGLGAGVAGSLAQWGPLPMVSPYVVHIAVTLPALFLLTRTVETRTSGRAPAGLRVPSARHRRFLRVVVPMAPWVFSSAGIAYAVMPQLMADRVGRWSLAYATLLTVVTLTVGVLVQPLGKRLDSHHSARASIAAMVLMTAGIAVAGWAAARHSPLLTVGVGVLLGGAYGLAMVSGLQEIQRIASPDELAGLTGVFYALSYIGFLVPAAMAALSGFVPYPELLAGLAVLAAASLAAMVVSSRRHLPVSPGCR